MQEYAYLSDAMVSNVNKNRSVDSTYICLEDLFHFFANYVEQNKK